MLIGFNELRYYPIVIPPLCPPINSSQSLSLSPCPHYQIEHKEVRSCGSSFSLMLMHILSLLHTNVSWPRLAVCLSVDLHLLSGYWPQFNLTLASANPRTVIIFLILRKCIFRTEMIIPQQEQCLKKKGQWCFCLVSRMIILELFLSGWTAKMLLDHWCGWQNIRFFLPCLNWFNLEAVSPD